MNVETANQTTLPLCQRWGPVVVPGGKTRFQLWAPAEAAAGLNWTEPIFPCNEPRMGGMSYTPMPTLALATSSCCRMARPFVILHPVYNSTIWTAL
jgi:hypothetical protein